MSRAAGIVTALELRGYLEAKEWVEPDGSESPDERLALAVIQLLKGQEVLERSSDVATGSRREIGKRVDGIASRLSDLEGRDVLERADLDRWRLMNNRIEAACRRLTELEQRADVLFQEAARRESKVLEIQRKLGLPAAVPLEDVKLERDLRTDPRVSVAEACENMRRIAPGISFAQACENATEAGKHLKEATEEETDRARVLGLPPIRAKKGKPGEPTAFVLEPPERILCRPDQEEAARDLLADSVTAPRLHLAADELRAIAIRLEGAVPAGVKNQLRTIAGVLECEADE